MHHLLAALRWEKLLSKQPTEHLQAALAILLGKDFPESVQRQPLILNLSRRKRGPSWLPRMVLLLEWQTCKLDTNPRASKKRRPILTETAKWVDID
jgi:hypothetical protein